jgi:hypothetical protein
VSKTMPGDSQDLELPLTYESDSPAWGFVPERVEHWTHTEEGAALGACITYFANNADATNKKYVVHLATTTAGVSRPLRIAQCARCQFSSDLSACC